MSVDGKALDKGLVDLTKVTAANRDAVFQGVFLNGKQRADLALQAMFVTPEEREAASELKNIKKVDLVKMIEELLLKLNDELALEVYRQKLMQIQKKVSSPKKEVIIALYEEVNQKVTVEDDNQEEGLEAQSENM